MKKFFFTAFLLTYSFNAFATTLTEALVLTYNNNPELIAKREELKATDEEKFSAMSGFLPQVTLDASNSSSKANNQVYTNGSPSIPQSPWSNVRTKDKAIGLKQNLFNGGGSVMSLIAAKYKIEQMRASLKTKEQEVFLKTIQAYNDVLMSKKIKDICKDNESAFIKMLSSTKEKFEAGLVTKTDVANAEAKLEKAKGDLIDSEGAYINALSDFKQQVGIDAYDLEPLQVALDLPGDLKQAIDLSLKFNPNLESAKAKQFYCDSQVNIAISNMLPNVDLTSSIRNSKAHYTGTDNTNVNYDHSPNSTTTKQVAVSLTIPIYQKGMEYSNIRKARATLSQAKSEYRQIIDSVNNGATETWTKYQSAIGSYAAMKKAEEAYKTALGGFVQEYQEGLRSLSDLLDTQTNYFSSQIQALQSDKRIKLSSYELKSVTGKLNAKDMNLPTKIYDPAANYNKLSYKFVGF